MGVKFAEKNAVWFLKLIGIHKSYVGLVENGLISFWLYDNAFKFSGNGALSGASVQGDIPPSLVSACNGANDLGKTDINFIGKAKLVYKVEAALYALLQKKGFNVSYIPKSPVTGDKAPDDAADVEEEVASTAAPVLEEPPAIIPLAQASKQYQRVHGTSPSSVYVAVAIADDIKLAAKMSGDMLDLRVEGNNIEKYAANLDSLGFSLKKGGSYASAHLQCNDNASPDKALGAVLMGIGAKFKTGLPDLNRVKLLGA